MLLVSRAIFRGVAPLAPGASTGSGGGPSVAREVILVMLTPDYLPAVSVLPIVAVAMAMQGIYLLTREERTELLPVVLNELESAHADGLDVPVGHEPDLGSGHGLRRQRPPLPRPGRGRPAGRRRRWGWSSWTKRNFAVCQV